MLDPRFRTAGLLLIVGTALPACDGGKGPRTAESGPVPTTTAPPANAAPAAHTGLPTAANTASASPLPLVAGARFEMAGEFRGTKQTSTLELQAMTVEGMKVFYFMDLEASETLVATVFGMGAFLAKPDGIHTADVLNVRGVAELAPEAFARMLALPVKVGDKASVKAPEKQFVPPKEETYTVAAIESVTVPAGTFDNCVRLTIDTNIDGERESSTVWLAPGVGVVKLARATGRVDELVKYTPGK